LSSFRILTPHAADRRSAGARLLSASSHPVALRFPSSLRSSVFCSLPFPPPNSVPKASTLQKLPSCPSRQTMASSSGGDDVPALRLPHLDMSLICDTTVDLRATMRRHFGHEAYRPGQEEVVAAVLSGRDVLAVM